MARIISIMRTFLNYICMHSIGDVVELVSTHRVLGEIYNASIKNMHINAKQSFYVRIQYLRDYFTKEVEINTRMSDYWNGKCV